ncbi:Retrotransposon protein, Ty3-gypsy subclass [Gossypium australe]|uniref:Retrotransposon protein, Ty3-gypsy subclass n=1 Tax=Gossypium australe TaxID=47621 RepID=A0A5B6WQH2_9ROSI|nr:Retrotransposon protein, Ty3-gypsy subclass [Gossypium australe]
MEESVKHLYWLELSESKMVGIDFIQETEDKAASDRKKSNTYFKRKDTGFVVGDRVFLKVSPCKKILRFGRKEKLSPRFIWSFEISKRIGLVAYRLALPPKLEKIHNVFHVLMLRWYIYDPSHVIPYSEIELQQDLMYSKKLVKILA